MKVTTFWKSKNKSCYLIYFCKTIKSNVFTTFFLFDTYRAYVHTGKRKKVVKLLLWCVFLPLSEVTTFFSKIEKVVTFLKNKCILEVK